MQIGGLNSIASSLYTNNKNSSPSVTTPIDVLVNSVFDKMGIEKKTEQKQQQIERALTGYGEEVSSAAKSSAEVSAQIYKAVLESELKDKIAQMSQKEQSNKTTIAQMLNTYTKTANNYQDTIQASKLSLSA